MKRDGLAIQQNIDLSKARYRTDFGKGFYLTNNLKQAEQWAIGRATDGIERGGTLLEFAPVVVYFHLDMNKLSKLVSLEFKQPTKEWAEFVFNCRSAGLKKELYHQYDYTVGPLADGRTNMLVRQMKNGVITLNEFLHGIMPYYKNSSQLALHTQEAIDCLSLVGGKEIEME